MNHVFVGVLPLTTSESFANKHQLIAQHLRSLKAYETEKPNKKMYLEATLQRVSKRQKSKKRARISSHPKPDKASESPVNIEEKFSLAGRIKLHSLKFYE